MLSKFSSHVRHNVVGYLALFFALSGTALGAGQIMRQGDSAGPPGDLTGTYPNPTIAAGAVTGGTGGKVADNSLTGDDVNEASLVKVPDADKLDGLDSTALGAGALMGQADCNSCANPGPNIYEIAPSGHSVLEFPGVQRYFQLTPNVRLNAGDFAARFGQGGWTQGSGAQVTFTLLLNGNNTSVGCTIVLDNGDHCESGNVATIPAHSLVSLEVETSAGVVQLVNVVFGWRLIGPV